MVHLFSILLRFASSAFEPVDTVGLNAILLQNTMLLSVMENKRTLDYSLIFPDGARLTVACADYQWRKVVASGGGASSLGYLIRCRSHRNIRKLVIWVHGGPWAYASTELVPEQLAFLEAGYDIFVPLYPGSSDRSVAFEGTRMLPDVVDAMLELRAAFNWGRANYGIVDVVGESFGAFLVSSLLPQLSPKDSILLVNPSLGGYRFLSGFYSKTSDLSINGVKDAETQRAARDVTAAYFSRLENYNALRKFEEAKNVSVKLIYGGRDKKILKSDIESLTKLAVSYCGIAYRAQNGHEFASSLSQYDEVRKLIPCRLP